MEDKYIIEKVLAGDTELFKYIIDKYKDKVANIIYSFCGKNLDVQDIAQTVFIKVYKSLSKFKFEADFSTWLYRIVINESITFAKRRKAKYNFVPLENKDSDDDDQQNLIDCIEDKNDNIETNIERKQTQQIVQRTLLKLKENYRAVITLRDIEDFSYEEIAKILNISTTKVKIDLFRARNKLKELLLKENLL